MKGKERKYKNAIPRTALARSSLGLTRTSVNHLKYALKQKKLSFQLLTRLTHKTNFEQKPAEAVSKFFHVRT